jgi:hypothetical protein
MFNPFTDISSNDGTPLYKVIARFLVVVAVITFGCHVFDPHEAITPMFVGSIALGVLLVKIALAVIA